MNKWLVLVIAAVMMLIIMSAPAKSQAPEIVYDDNESFITAVKQCAAYHNNLMDPADEVPVDIVAAMAVLETGYGKSRFAHEANNLFGIRTWDLSSPHVKPLNYKTTKWAVKKYDTKCDSVQDMMRILNNLHFYENFREARTMYLTLRGDLYNMVDQLSSWSTNPDYTILVKKHVQHVSLLN
jgi:uncharacterized FlgJ-related protein